MKSNFDDEPSLHKIDDFNGKESSEKRNTVRFVIIGLVLLAAIYSYFKVQFDSVDEYVGKPEQPGIDVSKK